MASRLFQLGRQASEYVRRRMSRAARYADEQLDRRNRQAGSSYVNSRRGLGRSLSEFIFGQNDRRYPSTPPQPPGSPVTPPPIEPRGSSGVGGGFPPRPPTGQPPEPPDDDDGYGPELGYGDIQLLGRDASYDPADWEVVMDQMRLTPGSTNVFGYYFEFEGLHRRFGILYVTFLHSYRGEQRTGAGPTYAYYDVPAKKYHEFRRATDTSAGGAVWDYLRVRGTIAAHQHNYRLVQVAGDYVPRKATPLGFRTRHLPTPGVGRREYRRSTLPERLFASPNRGEPDRGEPDRGN